MAFKDFSWAAAAARCGWGHAPWADGDLVEAQAREFEWMHNSWFNAIWPQFICVGIERIRKLGPCRVKPTTAITRKAMEHNTSDTESPPSIPTEILKLLEIVRSFVYRLFSIGFTYLVFSSSRTRVLGLTNLFTIRWDWVWVGVHSQVKRCFPSLRFFHVMRFRHEQHEFNHSTWTCQRGHIMPQRMDKI